MSPFFNATIMTQTVLMCVCSTYNIYAWMKRICETKTCIVL